MFSGQRKEAEKIVLEKMWLVGQVLNDNYNQQESIVAWQFFVISWDG